VTKERIAFILAPLTTPITFVMTLVGTDFNWDFLDLFETILMMAIFCIPVAYVIAFAFGLPLYIFFKKYDLINFYTLTIGAIFVANLPLILLWLFGAYESETHKLLKIAPVMSIIGFVVGFTFWAILNFPHNKSPQADADKLRRWS